MSSKVLSAVNIFVPFKNLLSGFRVCINHRKSDHLKRLGCAAFIHSSPAKLDLMEFFDEKDNWSAKEVRVGRSWKKEELRIKSNIDLHKLWYVLLKEQNMLLTMEHEYKQQTELYPSPERIYKVKESMVNLEEVVRERNRAYHMLEIGDTGERTGKVVQNRLGLTTFYKNSEHYIPPEYNKRWIATRYLGCNFSEVKNFLLYYREKLFNAKRKARIRDRNHVLHLLKRFPDLDVVALQEQYPHINVEGLKKSNRFRGHFLP